MQLNRNTADEAIHPARTNFLGNSHMPRYIEVDGTQRMLRGDMRRKLNLIAGVICDLNKATSVDV